MTPRMILIGVKFEGGDVHVPGLGGVDQLPDKQSGWTGKLEGYSMRIVGDRLEVWCPPIETQPAIVMAELKANGIEPGEALSMVSVPLHRCSLRYVSDAGPAEKVATECQAPTSALRNPPKVAEPKPAPVDFASLSKEPAGTGKPFVRPAAPANANAQPKEQPTPRGPVAPTPRKPPGARGPSKETGIVRDLSAEEAEAVVSGRSSVPLAVEHGSGSVEE